MNKATLLHESPSFSLVLGGPRICDCSGGHIPPENALELIHRRILFIPLFAWLPLLLLSLIGGHALGGAIKVPFLHDIEAHVRFLVALPVLIAAELVLHLRIRPAVLKFVRAGHCHPRRDYQSFRRPSTPPRACVTRSTWRWGASSWSIRWGSGSGGARLPSVPLVVASAAPLLPLLLTIFSLEYLVTRLVKILV